MEYYIYILRSLKYDKTYIGITANLYRRLNEHNSGKSIYTKKFLPWEIIFTEKVENRETARKREKYYKSAAGRIRIKKIMGNLSPGSSVDRAAVS